MGKAWLWIKQVLLGIAEALKAQQTKKPIINDPTPWLTTARKELGTKEVIGTQDNPRIITYHSKTTLKATSDEVPWCASFVTWCLETAGFPSTKSAAARSYATYGERLKQPKIGCIAVYTRQGGGHVAFYVGDSADGLKDKVLGGNQGNQVSVSEYAKENAIAYVWPVKGDNGKPQQQMA